MNMALALAGATVSILQDDGDWFEIGVVDDAHPPLADEPEPEPFILFPAEVSFTVPLADSQSRRLDRWMRRVIYGPPLPPPDGWFRDLEPVRRCCARNSQPVQVMQRPRRRQQHDMTQARQQKRRMFVQGLRSV